MKIILVISFLISLVSAQEMDVLERNLHELEKNYSVEKSKLDSINSLLQNQIDELDVLKRQEQRDNDKITLLMSQGHSVSKLSDAQNEIVTNLAAKIKKQRRTKKVPTRTRKPRRRAV